MIHDASAAMPLPAILGSLAVIVGIMGAAFQTVPGVLFITLGVMIIAVGRRTYIEVVCPSCGHREKLRDEEPKDTTDDLRHRAKMGYILAVPTGIEPVSPP